VTVEYFNQTFEITRYDGHRRFVVNTPEGYDINVNTAMHAWVRACANPTSITDIADALAAGLLVPGSEGSSYRYVATVDGRRWLIKNAMANGASEREAINGLDCIDGA
jgi:hypothetical protein